jgi:protein-disulfide isomerase
MAERCPGLQGSGAKKTRSLPEAGLRERLRLVLTIHHQTLLTRLASDYNSAPIERTRKHLESDWGGVVSEALKRFSVIGLGLALVGLVLAGPLWGQARVTPGDLTAAKSLGSREAPITIEVFADYQCPQCRLFYETVTRQLIDNYVSTGKVYLVHRDFPLSMHTYSHQAAHWLNAAAAAGLYATVEQALYDKQDEWAPTGKIEPILADVLSPAEMKKVRLVEATEGPLLDAAVASDMALGNSKHVDGTPTIFVSHRGQVTQLPTGGVNYALLKQYLDYLLQH